jgi:flagellar basal-body rod protein FlgC
MFNLLSISGAGMTANKTWLEAIGNNISNINTTRTEDGGAYRRQSVTFQEKKEFDRILDKEIGSGVEVGSLKQDNSFRIVNDPNHPDADAEGNVKFPEINMVAEMTDMMMAQRGYEANATTLSASRKIMEKELEIGR